MGVTTMNKTAFKKKFLDLLTEKFAISVEDASLFEIYTTLGTLIRSSYAKDWRHTWSTYDHEQQKQVYYFSIEFLPGRMMKSNLLNMGWLDTVQAALADLGIQLDDVVAQEPDMALGNGGLGRLASCFMDSIASEGLPGNGNGIRYKYGLFKQKFIDGYQVELPNEWLARGNLWEVRRESKSVDVYFNGYVRLNKLDDGTIVPVHEDPTIVRAVPYDTGMVGFRNGTVNTLRLWDAEIPLSEESHYRSIEQRRAIQDLTSVLYPDDSNEEGRRLRLMQEYFFVSAGVQSILRHFKTKQQKMQNLDEFVAIHINDTHPAMCVAEFMRLLLDEEKMSWERAWNLTVKVMSYTNHTIMSEALEKWSVEMLQSMQPRIYQIIEEIDRRFVEEMTGVVDWEVIQRTRIISDGLVHMAHLAIIGSHSTNGVAKLHSDLLKTVVLHDFYRLYPDRFNNKTNGIAERRWLQLANPSLSTVLDKTIGQTWRYEANDLHLLMNYSEDKAVHKQLQQAKQANKERLAAFILQETGVRINEHAIFDVQIKRLHAYKRQLLNLLHILTLYFEIKEEGFTDIQPRVFIFGAKAAPSYHYAKSIIKVINEVGKMIQEDPEVSDKLSIVFLEDYSVSLAEVIIPAADVSEQISLASKEASGTSNMKLMLNGAITIATLDGANIEIRDAVGDENIVIFGLTESQVYDYYEQANYHAYSYYEALPKLKRVVDSFVDGTIANIYQEGKEIFDSLLTYNDEFFVLRDYEAYVNAQKEIEKAYQNQERWLKMSLINVANAGRFSADYTVMKYAEDIWQIEAKPKSRKAKDEKYVPYTL